MKRGLTLTVTEIMNAPVAEVWDALVNPEKVTKLMFGATVISDWEEGSPIIWKGEWKGESFEDKGKILQLEPEKKLQYSHFSPLSGDEDKPENYHTVTIELAEEDSGVLVSLTQDNYKTEEIRDHSKKNWKQMLTTMKELVEESSENS